MYDQVLHFIQEQAEAREVPGPILEFGSLQVPGQEGYSDLRRFFPGKEYIGSDMRPGLGVDVVDDMEMSQFAPSSMGTILCFETVEHIRHPWIAMQEAYRILKPGGLLLVSAPFRFAIHDFPGDYWSMTAEGLKILIEQAGFEEVETLDSGEELVPGLPYPFTAFGVARKPAVAVGTTGVSVDRGPRHEAYAIKRANELSEDVATLSSRLQEMSAEVERRGLEIEAAAGYVATLESQIEDITAYARALEAGATHGACSTDSPEAIPRSLHARAAYYLATEGFSRTTLRGFSYLRRRLHKH
jgi:SAM-dependent methyltransferase